VNYDEFEALYERNNVQQQKQEFWWLIQKVRALEPKAIIEIGVDKGGSLKFWEQLVPKGDGFVLGVDNNPFFPENILWNYKNSDRQISFVRGDSSDHRTCIMVGAVLKYHQVNKVDFLWIDGAHHAHYPETDFMNYSPFVREGGIVGFHDLYLKGGSVANVFVSRYGWREALIVEWGTGIWIKGWFPK